MLGGHNHHVVGRDINDTNPDPEVLQSGFHGTGGEVSDYKGHVRIVKSGTDWRNGAVSASSDYVWEEASTERQSYPTCHVRNSRVYCQRLFIADAIGTLKHISDLECLPSYNQIIPSPKMLEILRTIHSKIEKEVAHPHRGTARRSNAHHPQPGNQSWQHARRRRELLLRHGHCSGQQRRHTL